MPHVAQLHAAPPTHLAGDFTRLQTKVPPSNPNDQIARPTDPAVNNSIDSAKYPIVIQQRSNAKQCLPQTREMEIKSILKRTAVPSVWERETKKMSYVSGENESYLTPGSALFCTLDKGASNLILYRTTFTNAIKKLLIV